MVKRTKIATFIVSALLILALTVPITTSTLTSGGLITAYYGTQGTQAQKSDEEVDITIMFHSDLHSELLPWPLADYVAETGNDPTVGGMARIANVINNERATAGEPVLVFMVGDFLMGTVFSFLGPLQASPELHLMSPPVLNYTAICLGNHEFDYSDHGLSLILNRTNSTLNGVMPLILCSNLNLTNDVRNLGAFIRHNATITVTVSGVDVKIGLFSLIGYGGMATMFFTGNYNILDPIETARQQVAYLRSDPDIDLIICLSHSGWRENMDLARKVPGIDLILSGHDHELTPEPITVGSTTIVDAGALGEYLGKLKITVKPDNNPGKGVTVRSWTLVHINDTVEENVAVANIIGLYRNGIDSYLAGMGIPQTGSVIANTTGVPGVASASGEIPIGNLVADAIRWQANNVSVDDPYVDFAFVPSGVIRHGLEPASGNITVYDAVSVVPLGGVPYKGPYFGWLLTSFYVLGSDVKKAMEFSLYAGGDYFLQISGLRVTYTPLGLPGSRIVSIEQDFQNGTYAPIDDNKLYRVCVNLEVALLIPEIGKRYPMFAITMRNQTGHPLPTDPEEYVPLILVLLDPDDPETAIPEWLALVNYLITAQGGMVDPAYGECQNRITVWEVEPSDYFMLVGLGQLLANQQASSGLMIGGVAVLLLVVVVGVAAALTRRMRPS
ncbi:MAG: bifunctional metallophosphatase/5'-nucleotidase [Candidatus Freyarchaeota archaeon]|nr:bifunctional metallophosphatase/5'-nucleotidase [Candidatus Jordarchaeia archaeon]